VEGARYAAQRWRRCYWDTLRLSRDRVSRHCRL